MKLIFDKLSSLPPLAWFAEVRNGETKVLHGTYVETSEKSFVEGAWDDEFTKGTFMESEWFCGTGGCLRNGKMVFSTPTHVTYGLFLSKIWGGVLCFKLPVFAS